MPFIKSGDQPRGRWWSGRYRALTRRLAFTACKISVGFDRRYGSSCCVTPLSRIRLLLAKATVAILVIEAIQIVRPSRWPRSAGWRPVGNPAGALGLVILAPQHSALSFALAGVLRAEVTLAAANAIYLILLLAGGTVIPAIRCRVGRRGGQALPSGALLGRAAEVSGRRRRNSDQF